jgi:hypothetical protein
MSISGVLFGFVDRAPALAGGEFQKATGRPFVIGQPGDVAEELLVGGWRVRHAPSLPIGHEIPPMLAVCPLWAGKRFRLARRIVFFRRNLGF